jgi:hypothetical protein
MVPHPGRGEGPRHHARGRSIAIILTVVCLSAAFGACGQGTDAGGRVSLVPSTAAKNNTWDWTSACRVGPHSPTGCDESGPVLGVAQLAGSSGHTAVR